MIKVSTLVGCLISCLMLGCFGKPDSAGDGTQLVVVADDVVWHELE